MRGQTLRFQTIREEVEEMLLQIAVASKEEEHNNQQLPNQRIQIILHQECHLQVAVARTVQI
jgi:hypothetical protein